MNPRRALLKISRKSYSVLGEVKLDVKGLFPYLEPRQNPVGYKPDCRHRLPEGAKRDFQHGVLALAKV
ncbi:MAG: hypothetical protein HWE20_11440 [Gammaproteobacteria bacterium]|nr:hypothetical protein [Gammaproteobacteria bacterium]